MPETWALGSRDLIELDEETEAYAGIDLARSNDWAAVSLVIPIGEDPKEYDVRTWAWTCERPSEGLSESLDLMELRARASNLTVCPGSQIDLVAVRDFCGELAGKVWVRSWAYDDAYARETAQHLTERTGLPLIKFLQSHKSYNEPTKRFLDELAAGRIRHGDDPLLKWQALNMHLHTNAKGHSMPDKLGKYKIDSMVALIMAFSEALCSTPADSYYTDNTVEAF
jgi:phage terminase large subunit-like protein